MWLELPCPSDGCREDYDCIASPWGESYCLPKGSAIVPMPHVPACRAECERFRNCQAEAHVEMSDAVPDWLNPDTITRDCLRNCVSCPDDVDMSEAQARIDSLDACLAAETGVSICEAAYWCRYMVDSVGLACSPECFQATATCLGVEITPELAWIMARAVILSAGTRCDETNCTTWLECSGYNAVKAYDAAHGG
jgi:hypothetical protein